MKIFTSLFNVRSKPSESPTTLPTPSAPIPLIDDFEAPAHTAANENVDDEAEVAALIEYKKQVELNEIRRSQIAAKARAEVREFNRKQIDEMKRQKVEDQKQGEKDRAERARAEDERRNSPAVTWETRFRRHLVESCIVSQPVIARIVEHGKLQSFIESSIDKLKPIEARYHKAMAERIEVSSLAAKSLFRHGVDSQLREIAKGGIPDRVYHDTDQLEREFAHRRLLIRETAKMCSAEAAPIVAEVAEKVQLAARAFAIDREEFEVGECRNLEIQYQPSAMLQTIIFAGFNLATRIKTDCHLIGQATPCETLGELIKK